VRRLLEDGVMQVVAVTDPARLGFDLQALVAINVDGDLHEVAGKLASIDEVEYVVITTGRFDVFAEVVCADTEGLLDLVNDRIRTIDGVRSTEVFTYLDLVKQTYSWGTR
jgi:Lrp/AsnC family transcriptional regulator for asnA, asnC and gidA